MAHRRRLAAWRLTTTLRCALEGEAGQRTAVREVRIFFLRLPWHESLLCSLLGDAHVRTDVRPGGAGAPRLVHEMSDQMVGDLADSARGLDRILQVLAAASPSGVFAFHMLDQVVEPNRKVSHSSTLG